MVVSTWVHCFDRGICGWCVVWLHDNVKGGSGYYGWWDQGLLFWFQHLLKKTGMWFYHSHGVDYFIIHVMLWNTLIAWIMWFDLWTYFSLAHIVYDLCIVFLFRFCWLSLQVSCFFFFLLFLSGYLLSLWAHPLLIYLFSDL